MYSPKIYEPLVPCRYPAGQATGTSMTRLVNAFVFEGLATGYYGLEAANKLPEIKLALHWLPESVNGLVAESPADQNHLPKSTEIQRLHAWYDSLQHIAEKYDQERALAMK